MHRIKLYPIVCASILWLVAIAGCTGSFIQNVPAEKHTVVKGENFLLVTATSQDSLASLAKIYLNDPEKAWWIAQYNQVNAVTAGQQLVIPLRPTTYGGLRGDGYQTVPILLYAHIAARPTKKESVSSENFYRQIQYLWENDFVPISLNQLNDFLNLQDQLPSNAVMISFDSDERWVYDLAFPILKRYGMKAALFVPTEKIGRPGKLTWQQLAKMADNGFSIGCHGTHLRAFNDKAANHPTRAIQHAISQSKKALEHNLKRPCHDFSTPFTEINDLTTAILKTHGYRMGLTSKPGQNPFFRHNFNIRRSRIHGHFNLHQFGRNLITFHKASLQ